MRLENISEGPPLLQASQIWDVCLQVPKLSFNEHPQGPRPAVRTDDRRCTVQVISSGMSGWREAARVTLGGRGTGVESSQTVQLLWVGV